MRAAADAETALAQLIRRIVVPLSRNKFVQFTSHSELDNMPPAEMRMPPVAAAAAAARDAYKSDSTWPLAASLWYCNSGRRQPFITLLRYALLALVASSH